MFSRKKPAAKGSGSSENAERKRGKQGGDLAAMFGLQMPDEDDDDESLEAELAALQGRSAKKKPKGPSKQKPMSMAEIEKLTAESSKLGEFDDDDMDDSLDDADLLAELEGMSSDDEDDDEGSSSAGQTSPAPPTTAVSSPPASKTVAAAPRPPAVRPPPPAAAATAAAAPVPAARPTVAPLQPAQAAPAAAPAPQNLSPMETLVKRHGMYEAAVKYAKEQGDTSKLRRYDRGFKSLASALKKAKAGGAINLNDLPPELAASAYGGTPSAATPAPAPPQPVTAASQPAPDLSALPVLGTKSSDGPSPVAQGGGGSAVMASAAVTPVDKPVAKPRTPQPSPSSSLTGDMTRSPAAAAAAASPPRVVETDAQDMVKAVLSERMHQYLEASHSAGSGAAGRRLKLTAAKFQKVLKAHGSGQPIDLSQMPPPPPGYTSKYSAANLPASAANPSRPAPSTPTAAALQPAATARASVESPAAASAAPANTPDDSGMPVTAASPSQPQVDPAIKTPTTVLEALQQRLDKYTGAQKQAQEAGESGKARRMGRIAKQYQDAIKATKAKRSFDYSELPCPPGYPPIPGTQGASPAAAAAPSPAVQSLTPSPAASLTSPSSATSSLSPMPAVAASASPASSLSSLASASAVASASPASSLGSIKSVGVPSNAGDESLASSVNEEQLRLVKARMEEYKAATLEAKTAGRTTEALAHFRIVKGLEPMLAAAESGLPVDMDSIPPSLSSPPAVERTKRSRTEEDEEIFERLADSLSEQITTCSENAEQYRRIGDVKGAAAYDREVSNLQADLDMLNNANRYEEAAPRFHYEEREFSIVRSFPDMGENDAEVIVERCHSLPLPSGYKEKDMQIYVVVLFPFPHDEEPSEKTHTVKMGVNPVFEKSLRFSIDRKSRSLARTIKRHPVKLEVFYERGFLKSDQSLGVGSILITDLETKAEVHANVDLMEGRKACGGKVEARVRFRQPLTGRDIQKTKHRWLVIDDYVNRKSLKPSIPPPQAAQRVKQATASGGDASTSGPIQSIEVLRSEIRRLEKAMNELKANRRPVPAVYQQRHQAASEKAAALEKQLRTGGKPFLRSYIAQLKAGVEKEQARAKLLLQKNDKAGAQSALLNKKLMSSELERWASASL